MKLVFTNAACCFQEALAPYKHIEEDLKSLKEVLEMKNQQIHQQDMKISELEKIVSFKCLHWCIGEVPNEMVSLFEFIHTTLAFMLTTSLLAAPL